MLTGTNGVLPNHLPVIVASEHTTNHIVDTCPLTKFEGGPNLLLEADDDAVIWLESTPNSIQYNTKFVKLRVAVASEASALTK